MSGLKVLIIDSNKNFSRTAKNYLLVKCGVTAVETAVTGAEALSVIDNLKPDLLLVDEFLIREGSIRPEFISLIRDKLPRVKIALMVLYPQDLNINGFPCIEHFNGSVSKQDFAADTLVFINSCFNSPVKD